jgi:hypothetical protein
MTETTTIKTERSLSDLVRGLIGYPITRENMARAEQIFLTFSSLEQQFIEQKVRYQVEKWKIKRGEELNQDFSESVTINFRFMVYLRFIVNRVLDCFGVSGGMKINYHGLATKLQSKFKKLETEAWDKTAKLEIEHFSKAYGINEEIAQVVALFVAMLVRKYYIGM